MKRIARVLEVLGWTVFFAFAATVLALRFWLLPKVEQHRDEIAAYAARAIGQPVKIGAIEAGWLGLRPQISLADVRVLDAEGREALVLPSVENVLSWRSLVHWKLRLHSLVIDGPRLTVRREADGTLYVAGLKVDAGAGGGGASDWLLGQEEIVVRNAEIEWRDDKRGAPPLALSALNLRLRSSGEAHAIGLVARPPAALGSRVELRAELTGRGVTDPAAWSGKLFAELGATDLAAWRAWVDYPLDVREARGELRLWATLQNGALTEATADVALAQVLARLAPELPPLELAALRGRLQARALPDGYELGARDLSLTPVRGAALQPADFQVTWSGGAAEQRGSASARLIEFEPLVRLAAALPIPAEVRERIAELAPVGRLIDARFEWHGSFPEPQRFNARARFVDLGLRSFGGAPGFSGLSGTIEASEKKGRLFLATRGAEIHLPQVFPEPRLAFDTLGGQVDWERLDDGGTTLRLTSASFANADAAGTAYGSYTRGASGPGVIDLTAAIARADGSRIARYLPHARLLGGSPKLRQWLADSIVAGQASDARLRLRGNLQDFPFTDPARGQFLITARVERGVLAYDPEWPRIENIDGELQFERDSMTIVGRGGTILGTRLANVRAHIPSLSAKISHLLISGQAAGPTGEFLKFVSQSPVRREVDGLTDDMQAAGNGTLRLKLDLPIEEPKSTTLAGEFEFAGNTLTVTRELPPLERASGVFAFTQRSFDISRLSARLFGGPVEITGGSRGKAGVEIAAQGRNVRVGELPFLDRPWRDHVSGTASYAATVTVREGSARVKIESSLRGVTSTLPAPLAKAPGDALPLTVEVFPGDGGARDRISVALGRLAAAELLRRRQGEAMVIQRAGLSLSPPPGQPVALPERPGTLVYGSLGELDLDRWLALAPSSGGAFAGSLDVRIGTLDLYGKRLTGLTVRAGSDAVGWQASIDAKELSGDVSWRGDRGVLARLDYLSIPPDSPGAGQARSLRPGDMPAVDIVAERFDFRGKPFGQLMVAGSPREGQWRLERLALSGPDATLKGSGLWRAAPDGTPASELEFHLETADAGAFLDRVGFVNVVKGGKATLLGSLAWRGEPSSIDFRTLAGDLKLDAAEGQFLEIEPGIGKLIGLMSLQQLPRRIGLDFRDVFSKGFRFEQIAAEAHVEKGVMALREFAMRGSAADVLMTGEVDIVRETQNLHVRVVPGLGDTASTAIAIVNPAVGLGAAILQRILKNPLGQLFAQEYIVTGTWADPKPVRVERFRGAEKL